jgi:ribosome maturation factor RimP
MHKKYLKFVKIRYFFIALHALCDVVNVLGDKSPLFYCKNYMYRKHEIEDLIAPELEKNDFFLVSLNISKGNKINIEVDGMHGISIDQCVGLSRIIESGLDREAEDFELQVSSPGATKPFKVFRQFLKHLNKEIEVVLADGSKIKGELMEVDEGKLVIEYQKKIKIKGKKKKKEFVTEREEILMNQVKSARGVVSFK